MTAPRRRTPLAWRGARPVAVLVAAVAAAEITGVVSGRHRPIPNEVLVANLVAGCPAALFALGLVLVYRASRVISFAQAPIAIAAGIVFLTMQAEKWPYALCAAAAVVGATLAAVILEMLFLRRFASSPRLVPTVVTIAGGQLVVAAAFLYPKWRFGIDLSGGKRLDPTDIGRVPGAPAHSPWTHLHLAWGVEVFTGDHLAAAAVTIVVCAALAIFFRRSNVGIAIRGAAENPEKASTLGIGTGLLSSLVWAIAGALAGLAVLTQQPLANATLLNLGSGFGIANLLAGLAAGVLARMEDLPTTVAAALGLSMFTGAVFFSTTNESVVEVVLLVVLAAALLSQRQALGRVQAAVSAGWAAAEEIRAVPAVLRNHESVRAGRRWAIAVGAIVVLGYPFAMSPSQVYLGATFAIFGIVAVSLVVLTGWGGQISLGQFAFVGVGAAVGGGLSAHGWPFAVAWAVATVAGGLVAMLLGLPALRLRGLFLAVITLGFAVVMADFFLDPNRFPGLTPSRVARPKLLFINFASDRAFYYLCLGGVAVALFVGQGLRRTRTGRVLIAMRDNEPAAQALGLSLVRVRLTTFAISGALAAFAGMLYASQVGAVRADGFGADQSIQIFLMAVIGGLGSVTGVLAGAVYLGCIQLFIHSAALQALASGGGVLVILLFFPSGVGGAVFAARDAFLRRVALRDKILVTSLLGDLRTLDSDENRAHLAPKVAVGPSAEQQYTLDSDIADAGISQRGKGWVYG